MTDNISSELLSVLDKLNSDLNRQILQEASSQSWTDIGVIRAKLSERNDVPHARLAQKIASMEKAQLVETQISDDGRKLEKIRLTEFGVSLIRALLDCQKKLEAQK
jgi:DNA-binding MarR family transcriptional regulator